MMHFSRSIMHYRSHGRFHGEIRSFSCWLFSHLCSSKSKKIALFCYLTWLLRFAMAYERNFHIETFIFIVSLSLFITKCSVTHNKVMNIHDFLDYMLKSSKCGPHASKMKSWILHRLRSTQKYPHFEDFFIEQKWLKFRIFYHISTPCDNICVKPAEGYNLLGAFESALYQSNRFVFSKWLLLKGIWL